MKHAKGSPFSSDYQSQADWSPNTKARPPHQGGWGNGPHLKAIDKGRGSIGYLGCDDHVKAAAIKKPSQM